jgi:hypothetical protein
MRSALLLALAIAAVACDGETTAQKVKTDTPQPVTGDAVVYVGLPALEPNAGGRRDHVCLSIGKQPVALSGTVYLASDFVVCFGPEKVCEAKRELRASDTYVLDLDSITCVAPSSGATQDVLGLFLQTPSSRVRRELQKRLHHRTTVVGTLENPATLTVGSVQ